MDITSITSIVVALISSAGGIIGAALAVKKGNRENEIKDALREQRQSDRLDRIEEKMSELGLFAVDIGNPEATTVSLIEWIDERNEFEIENKYGV